VPRDLALMLADGGECLSDLSVLPDQPELFGLPATVGMPRFTHRRRPWATANPKPHHDLGACSPWAAANTILARTT
jgi:hypothetical protein